MQTRVIRVVHYLNQFFGGVGGENKADVGPQVRNGPVGPGRALQSALGGEGEVVATVICGDNYFAEKMEEAAGEVIRLLSSCRADVLIAGPAFDAGRYGIACGAVCKAVENELGIPAVTGMHEENPGVDLFSRNVYIVKTGETVAGMAEAISRMAGIALKLATGQDAGKPSEGGYFSRGLLVNVMAEKTGAERVVSMLLAKLAGEPFEAEVTLPKYDRIEPAPGIRDIGSATIALVTDGGLVPRGNPDRIEQRHATRFGAYSIDLIDPLNRDGYEVNHGGYDAVFVNEDPNRLLPVDVMRDLEKEGVIGKLHDTFYSTSGLASVVKSSEKMGKGIAEQLKAGGVSGAILTSTWGTSTRCGAALVKELERAGIPSAHVCSITSVAQTLGSNRIIPAPRVGIPMGDRDLDPTAEKALRRAIVEGALEALQTEIKEQKLFPQHG